MNLKVNSRNYPRRRTCFPAHLKLYQTWMNIVGSDEGDDVGNEFNSDLTPVSDSKPKDSFISDGKHDIKTTMKSSKVYTCSHCRATFNLKGNLKVHLRSHSGLRPFECKICKKGFRSKDSMLRHELTHTGAKPFPCDICSQGFSSAVALKEHQARHNNVKLYKCNICGREFRQNSCYRRHLATHSKEAPYLCEICSQQFTQTSYLRSHLLVHTGERSHSCQKCGKAFSHLSDLKRHKVTHTGKRPYKCNMCSATFADCSSRKRHQKEHTNKSRMFVCHLCGFSFKQMKHVENHIKKKHSTTAVVSENGINSIGESNASHTQTNKAIFNCALDKRAQGSITNSTTIQNIQNVHTDPTASLIPSLLPQNNALETHGSQDCFQTSFCINNNDNSVMKNLEVKQNFTTLHHDNSLDPSLSNHQTSYNSTSLQEILAFPSQIDYVEYPNFSSQDYYNWLSNFTSLCRLLSVPIETELFTKITQVHKSIADVLASPTGIVSNRENFKILMNIAEDLHHVINNQLTCVLDHLQN